VTTRRKSKMPRWSVDLFRQRGHHLGEVEAADADEAIDKAMEEFGIAPQLRNKVGVTKIDKRK
jgi:hypothetical protein